MTSSGDEVTTRPRPTCEAHAGHAQGKHHCRTGLSAGRPHGLSRRRPMEAERLSQDPSFAVLDRGRGAGCFFFWVNQNPQAPWGKTFPGAWNCFRKSSFAERSLMRSTGTPSSVAYSAVTPNPLWTGLSHFPLGRSFGRARGSDPQDRHHSTLAELTKLGVLPASPTQTANAGCSMKRAGNAFRSRSRFARPWTTKTADRKPPKRSRRSSRRSDSKSRWSKSGSATW